MTNITVKTFGNGSVMTLDGNGDFVVDGTVLGRGAAVDLVAPNGVKVVWHVAGKYGITDKEFAEIKDARADRIRANNDAVTAKIKVAKAYNDLYNEGYGDSYNPHMA